MIATTLVVPGLHGSGPGHWQTWLERRIAGARRVEQDDWEAPVLARWAGSVRREIDRARGAVFIVAHSFGCLAAVTAAIDRRERVAGALLVAPADPDRFSPGGLRDGRELITSSIAADLPASALGFPSIVVASGDDPWLRLTRAAWWAERWGSRFLCLGNVGHINVDSGFGAWPEGLALFDALRRTQEHALVGGIADPGPSPRQRWRAQQRTGRRQRLRQDAMLG